MNVHKNARLTHFGREQIVRRYLAGETPRSISGAVGVSPASIYKWLRRFKAAGIAGLAGRSSRPRQLWAPTLRAKTDQVEVLRRYRMPMWKIALQTGLSRSTVARVCKRLGLSRLKALDPKPAIVRYEKGEPGDMIHIDILKMQVPRQKTGTDRRRWPPNHRRPNRPKQQARHGLGISAPGRG